MHGTVLSALTRAQETPPIYIMIARHSSALEVCFARAILPLSSVVPTVMWSCIMLIRAASPSLTPLAGRPPWLSCTPSQSARCSGPPPTFADCRPCLFRRTWLFHRSLQRQTPLPLPLRPAGSHRRPAWCSKSCRRAPSSRSRRYIPSWHSHNRSNNNSPSCRWPWVGWGLPLSRRRCCWSACSRAAPPVMPSFET